MMIKYTLIVLLLFGLPIYFCNKETNEQNAVNSDTSLLKSVNNSSLEIEIEDLGKFQFNKELILNWGVKNLEDKPIYVYSSLISSITQSDIYVDSNKKEIEVHFTKFKTFEGNPYYFPETKFIKLEPGETNKQKFVTKINLSKEGYFDSPTGIKLQNINRGIWHFKVVIGYGDETNSVFKKIADVNLKGREHPINPVVEWQKIAYSKSVEVSIE